MFNCRSNDDDESKCNKDHGEVVKMLTMPLTKDVSTSTKVKKDIKNPKKKRSALEFSDSIGVHGAFGHTLSDLHRQGR